LIKVTEDLILPYAVRAEISLRMKSA